MGHADPDDLAPLLSGVLMGIDFSPAGKGPNWLGLVEAGMDARRKYDAREAYGALVVDPQDTQAFERLARVDPDTASQFDTRRRKEQQAARVGELTQRAVMGDRAAKTEIAGFDLDAWGKIDAVQRDQIKQQVGTVAQLAFAADTPEKWATALGQARAMGIDTTGYETFESRQTVLAQAGMLDDYWKANQPKAPDYVFDSESGSWLQKPGTGSAGFGGGVPAAAPGAPSGGSDPSGVFESIIKVESGGRPGVVGPQTQYGQALGMTQMLPATAKEQAQKLGLPWREYLMRGTSPEAAQYQRTLGESYFNEGLQRYGGDIEKAVKFYHGGPNERLWGPKTESYARKVLGGGAATQAAPAPQTAAAPGVINVRPPKQRERPAPSGYRWDGERLAPIPGGPADPSTATGRNVENNRKAEANFRKEFDALPEVKTFKAARQQFNTLRDIGQKKNPTPQDDIALIFNFMKTLDPTSVVREGEFATAQNAASISDSVRNQYNKALQGTRLNPQQRRDMVRTAYSNYKNYRDAYNQAAENYRGYARDNGISPDRVARTYTPDRPAQPQQVSPTIKRIR